MRDLEYSSASDGKTSYDLLKNIDSMKWKEPVEGLSAQVVDNRTALVWYKKSGNEWEP